MKPILTFLLLTLFFTACQVKEQAGTTDLVSGHSKTTNAFKLLAPSSQTLITGDVLSLTVTFPFNVIVVGTPQLSLTIGATARTADYVSGDGTTTLVFEYLIAAADNDADGIAVNSLDLNGGTLQFSNKGLLTDCNVASITSKTFSNVLVDNTGASITDFDLASLPGFYNKSDILNFTLTFNEAVFVTGTPRFAIGLNTGGTVYAQYNSGSGSSLLVFSLTISESMADVNGFNSITSPLELNGGTITDSVGNNASLAFAALVASVQTYSATVLIDGRLPYSTSVTNPPNGTYLAAQNLDVTVNFDRAVNVTGSPYIGLTIGSNLRQATYLSGNGTSSLVFRYTLVPGDVDANGITISSSITQNSGNIVGTAAPTNSYFTYAGNNILSLSDSSGVICNSIQPQIISISRNVDSTLPIWGSASADNVWIIGQELLISVAFNTGIYVNQTSGVPRIPLNIGGSTQYATYLSGGNGQSSLIFRYVIQESDLDSDGSIGLSDIDLNGGAIYDVANTNILLTLPVASLTSTTIDGVRPTISSISAPANKSYSTITGNNHLTMTFVVNWSEAVNYSATGTGAAYISINMGGTANHAQYSSGNNTATISHKPGSLSGITDSDGVSLSSPLAGTANIKDRSGNTSTDKTFSPPNTSGVIVDTTLPLVSSITPPANSTYGIGQNLNFDLNFSESVEVNKSLGYPRIPLTIGATTVYLEPTSNGTGTSHTFHYTIIAGDTDTNGVATGTTISHNGSGYVRDLAQNLATTAFIQPTTTGVLVDGIRPTITSVTASANKTYIFGETIDFSVNYSESVNVTGTPRLTLTVGATTRYADYLSGSGSNVLLFRYTVPSGDLDSNGISVATTVDLNAGTIKDIAENDQTVLTFSAPLLSGVNVDGVVPEIISISEPANSTYGIGGTLDYIVNFDQPITVTGTPALSLNIGGASVSASYLSGSGTAALTFRYTVVANDIDTNGVQIVAPLVLAGGALKNANGNDSALNFASTVHAGVLVDAVGPAISLVSPPTAAAYKNGGARPSITFTVTFNENVLVTGTPRIHLTIGSTTAYADYASGSGTAALNFTYPVAATDLDLDGIELGNSSNIDLNAGTLMDATSNNADINLGTVSTERVTVVYPSMRNWYDVSDADTMTIVGGNVTAMNDRIESLNLTHSAGGVPYTATGFNTSTSAYVSCNDSSSFESSVSADSIALVAVFKSPVANTGYLYWQGAVDKPMIEFSSLNQGNLAVNGGQYISGSFGSGVTLIPNFWASTSGNHYVRAVKWDTNSNLNAQICQFDGQLTELFMFSSVPTNAQLIEIENYISTKHNGLTFP